MQIETIPIRSLVAYENNPKRHPEGQIRALKESLHQFGWTNPVLVDSENVVIAGHGRLEAAAQIGMQTVPVVRISDLTPEQVKAYRIADNRIAELSEWDPFLLAENLVDLDEIEVGDSGFTPTGFKAGEIAKILNRVDPDGSTEIREPAKKKGEVVCPRCGHIFDPKAQ